MTFICSKHFVGGKGPTSDHPDPIPDTACPQEVKKFMRTPRKPPTTRTTSTPADTLTKRCETGATYDTTECAGQTTPKYTATLCLAGQQVGIEIDTGAEVSSTSEEIYKGHFSSYPLKPTSVTLMGYQDCRLELAGVVWIHMQYGTQKLEFPLVIVVDRPALVGLAQHMCGDTV
ncbi:hypothetical protein LSAT2_027291 [Lamellibrachia satsuma]|nr:hypothetical protein LSAT2_027291 [Lamellibrachia satsuma]